MPANWCGASATRAWARSRRRAGAGLGVFLGKFLALAVLVAGCWCMVAGVSARRRWAITTSRSACTKVLLGLQLADYLLFALLALALHTWSTRRSGHCWRRWRSTG